LTEPNERRFKKEGKTFKIRVDLKERFEAYCAERKIEQGDAAEEALSQYMDGRRKDKLKPETMRIIENLYEGKKCRSCNRDIKASETCWFGRDETGEGFIICVECHSNANRSNLSARKMADDYEEIRRLQVIKAQLIKENNELADSNNAMKDRQSNLPRLEELLEQLIKLEAGLLKLKEETEKEIGNLSRIAAKFLQEKVGTAKEQEWIATFPENIKKLNQKSEDIDKEISEVRKLRQEVQSEIRRGLLLPVPARNPRGRPGKIPLTVTVDPVKAGQRPPEEDFSSAYDPNNSARKESGQIWCEPDTLWVYPKKCELCKERNPSRWNECQQKKRKPEDSV